MVASFRVRDGFPKENCGPDGMKAVSEHQGPWHQRWDFINWVLGYGGMIYPWRERSRARAVSTSAYGIGASGCDSQGFMAYKEVVITVNWEPPSDENPETEDLINESIEPTTEFLTLDHEDFRWGSSTGDKLQEAEAPGKLVRGLDYVVTQYQVRRLPSAILSLTGCCNSMPFRTWTLGWSFGAETLLYQPPTLSRKITTDGADAWQVTHRLSYRSTGWNRFWRSKTQSWESIYHKDGGLYKNFPLGNFQMLFTIG